VTALGVVDYGVGNLKSVVNALEYIGIDWTLVDAPSQIFQFDRILLPGVGSFGAAMGRLEETGLRESLVSAFEGGAQIMGICLGMQLLTDGSEESPLAEGLAIIRGATTRLPESAKTTNTGFRTVTAMADTSSLVADKLSRDYYFNHGYHVEPSDSDVSIGTARYGGQEICAAIEFKNACGVQFHPEKSQGQGLAVLRHFALTGGLRL
jgi:glutamine amidotransferase